MQVSPSLKQVLRDLISNSNFEGSLASGQADPSLLNSSDKQSAA